MSVYDKDKVHQIVSSIPKGKITYPSRIATEMGLNAHDYQRAVGKEVCRCKEPDKYHVLLKSKKNKPDCFPHWDTNKEDTEKQAKLLEEEGVLISNDRTRVLDVKNHLWDFNKVV